MNKTVLTAVLLTAAWCLFAQQGIDEPFDLYGGVVYRGTGSQTLNFTLEGEGLVVSGRASGVTPGGGGGYIIESRENLEFNDYKTLIIRVSGIDKSDEFNLQKLLKLELNKTPQQTFTTAMKNWDDPNFINALEGEAEFDLSKARNIRSVNLVFFNCKTEKVKIEIFYRN
jgi:hypothetical protein